MSREAPISVPEALGRLDSLSLDWGVEVVDLADAVGRVLAAESPADRDFPPFHRVAMDGVALAADVLSETRRHFRITGIQAAGQPALELGDAACAIEVMTGAVLPRGAGLVVPVEDVELEGDGCHLREGVVLKPGMNIHAAGSDAHRGDVLLRSGQALHGPTLAIAAALGMRRIRVRRRPRIAVLATGSELVDVDEVPLPHQIRVTNLSALCAGLDQHGYSAAWSGRVADEPDTLRAVLGGLLEAHDVLVVSGGVSKGRFDHVPRLLEELGCRALFHGVRQRPGRPLLAAQGPEGQLVLALPGNPVSAVVTLHRYLLPLLHRREGRPEPVRAARLATPLHWGRPLALFLCASLEEDRRGLPRILPLPTNGSGDFVRLGTSHGFLELDEGSAGRRADEIVPFWPWAPR